jgi:hypothetical protein
MVVADRDGRCDVLDYAESLEWRTRLFPQLRMWGWFSKVMEHPFNEIVDHTTMVLKFLVVKAEIKLFYEGAGDSKVKDRQIQVIITTFNETSTLVWIDALSSRIARRIHQSVLRELRARRINVLETPFAILHKREGRPTIEQRAKRTFAAKGGEHILKDLATVPRSETLLKRFEEAFMTPTWFDKFRGKRSTFIVVLIFQVLGGLTINWLSITLLSP